MSDGEPGRTTGPPPKRSDSKYAFRPRQPTRLLYDIAVEVRGIQDEYGCSLDQVRVGRWILGSMIG